jgi:uncharacterized membrane protein YjdF
MKDVIFLKNSRFYFRTTAFVVLIYFFIFHIIGRHFDFLAWQQCFYFYIALELQKDIKK